MKPEAEARPRLLSWLLLLFGCEPGGGGGRGGGGGGGDGGEERGGGGRGGRGGEGGSGGALAFFFLLFLAVAGRRFAGRLAGPCSSISRRS